MRLLLVHGPSLNLFGERPGDDPAVTLHAIEAAVRAEALRVGFSEVRFFQSNHEGALVDALQEARGWASGVVMNPGALSHSSYVLRDAVFAVRLPVVEVHLSNLDTREPWRKQAVLADVVKARIHGKGVEGYLEAVRLLAAGAGGVTTAQAAASTAAQAGVSVASGVTSVPSVTGTAAQVGTSSGGGVMATPGASSIAAQAGMSASSGTASMPTAPSHSAQAIPALGAGAVSPAPVSPPPPSHEARAPSAPRKTLGRRRAEEAPGAAPSKTLGRRPANAPSASAPGPWPSGVPSLAEVAVRLARHLSGGESAESLAAWARSGWLLLDGGAAVPASERTLLEEALRRLMFLDRKAGALDAPALVELLARLQ